MMQPPQSPPPLPESFGLIWLIALFVLSFVLQPAPGGAAPQSMIALASPRFVALSPSEAASASRLLGSVAAEAMAQLGEDWR